MSGGADRVEAVSLPVGLVADKDAEDGFGPSLGREAAAPQEIIARLISVGYEVPVCSLHLLGCQQSHGNRLSPSWAGAQLPSFWLGVGRAALALYFTLFCRF